MLKKLSHIFCQSEFAEIIPKRIIFSFLQNSGREKIMCRGEIINLEYLPFWLLFFVLVAGSLWTLIIK